MKRLLYTTLIFFFAFSLSGCSIPSSTDEAPSYEAFVDLTESLYNQLKGAFNVYEKSFTHINIQPYSHNEADAWAETIGDHFQVINDKNLEIGDSFKVEIFALSEDKSLMAKVGLHYNPSIKGRDFLAINHLDEVSEFVIGDAYQVPLICQETFTNPGLVVQVTVFSVEETTDRKKTALDQSDFLQNLTETIQKFLLEYDA